MTMFPKPGIVRLRGKELAKLRRDCFERDGYRCQKCGKRVYGHVSALNPLRAHMAHVRNKRMFGDCLSNVRTLCMYDHLVTVHNPKSVPPKEIYDAVRSN